MGKYVAKQFLPTVHPEWGELLEDLSIEKQAEILNAIIKYPSVNPSGGVWKFIKSQLDREFEAFTSLAEKNRQKVKSYWECGRTTVSHTTENAETDNQGKPQLTAVNQSEPISLISNQVISNQVINNKYSSSDKSSEELVKSEPFDLTSINSVLKKFNLPEVKKLTPARKVKLSARVKDCGGFAEFLGQMEVALAGSSFLRGENDRGWRADFDFFLQESKWIKATEGGFADKTKTNEPDFSWLIGGK